MVIKLKESVKQFYTDWSHFTEITDKVAKINIQTNDYAFKRTDLSILKNETWFQLMSQPLPAIVPFVPINEQAFISYDERYVYYVTPWVESIHFENINLKKLFSYLADFHATTKKQVAIYKDEWSEKMEKYKKRNDELKREVENIVSKCEQEHYMSPFAFQFCLNFKLINEQIFFFQNIIYLIIQELEKEPIHSYCINHGRLKREHILWSNRLCLINLEKAQVRNPVYDLLCFYTSEIIDHFNESSFATYKDAMLTYDEIYNLSRLEKLYFILKLADPSDYIDEGKKYCSQKLERPMIEIVIQQQSRIRLMRLAKYIYEKFKSEEKI